MLHFTYNYKYAALRINTLSLYAGNTAQATDEIYNFILTLLLTSPFAFTVRAALPPNVPLSVPPL